ncbi:MAG: endonuclease/exonuclease/phosphatase family protein [Chloroflexota bacterium]
MTRIISYNIRYNNPADGDQAWPHRKDRVASLLQLYQPEIIGLQEVLNDQLAYLIEALPEFEYVGVGRDDGQTKGEYAPIFYRRDQFALSDSGTFWLSETPDQAGSFGWDAACVRIATWAILTEKSTQKQFLHLNTHFDHRGQQAQIRSAELILKFLSQQQSIGRIIVTGDFNCVADSESYTYLTGVDQPDKLTLIDAMLHSQTRHHGPTGTLNTNFTNPIRDKIDFIFVWPANKIQVHRHAILADHWDGVYSSDHLPVLVDFT